MKLVSVDEIPSLSEEELLWRDDEGCTLLICATKAGCRPIVRALLAANVDVNSVDNDEHSALSHAVSIKRWDLCCDLLSAGARVVPTGNAPVIELILAASSGPLELCLKLIEAGEDVNALSNDLKDSALHRAAGRGDDVGAPLARALINAGAELDPVDVHMKTPLLHAAERCNWDTVKVLIEGGADANCAGVVDARAPLAIAAEDGRVDVMEALLDAGALTNPNNAADALYWATASNELEAALCLLRHDAKDASIDLGIEETALLTAIANRNLPILIAIIVAYPKHPALPLLRDAVMNTDKLNVARAKSITVLRVTSYACALLTLHAAFGRAVSNKCTKVFLQRSDSSLPVFESVAMQLVDVNDRVAIDENSRLRVARAILGHCGAVKDCDNRFDLRMQLCNLFEGVIPCDCNSCRLSDVV